MGYDRRFFNNLPVYARIADEEKGLLKFICDAAIQPELDFIYRILQQQEYYYDPNHSVSWDHLDWLGQFVGLGAIQGHWLGIGLNPEWEIATKIDVINRAFQYWQIKGTDKGIREAISMWLRFNDSDRLLIKYPFGKSSKDIFASWQDYFTPYDTHLNQHCIERQSLGWGNYWGQTYRANYHSIQPPFKWDYFETWSDLTWDYIPPHETIKERSRLGDREMWMHFCLKENEWNTIFPDIFELNLETLPATTTATVFGWLNPTIPTPAITLYAKEEYINQRTYTDIELDGVQYGQLVSIAGVNCPVFPLPGRQEPYIYGGTIYPYAATPSYYTNELVAEGVWWGVWNPEYWDGAWWGRAIPTEDTFMESFLEPVALDFAPIETFTVDWEINMPQLIFIQENIPAPELWYVPWGQYFNQKLVSVFHEGISCTRGVPFSFDDEIDTLKIDYGQDPDEYTNQILNKVAEEYYLDEPIKITTHYDSSGSGYSYYCHTNTSVLLSDVARPMKTFEIALDFEPVSIYFFIGVISGNYCNVFAAYSTLTPVSINTYTIIIYPEKDYPWSEIYPIIACANDGDNWSLLLETSEEVFIMRPTTMFWYAETNRDLRSQSFDFEGNITNLYLEFVFKPKQSTQINYTVLSLCESIIQSQSYYYGLNTPNEAYVGLSFSIPFRLASGAYNLEQEILLEEILPQLTQEIRKLAGLPPTKISVNSTNPGIPMCQPVLRPITQTEMLEDILKSLRDDVRKIQGDKHYSHTINSPIMELRIVHNLKKLVAVSFIQPTSKATRQNQPEYFQYIDNNMNVVRGLGVKSEPDVEYIDINTIIVRFSQPSTGILICN